jgi:cytochrome P450
MADFWLLLLLAASAVWVIRAWRARRFGNKARKAATYTYPPGLEPYPLIGHLPQFLANRHRVMDWMAEALERQPTATFVLRRPGGVRGAITANPANVEHFLRASFDTYPKGPRFASLLHDFLGRGIFNADGEAWRSQRKVASHEFNTRSLRAFVARCVHAELHGRLLPLLRRAAASGSGAGARLDLQDVLERFAFDNVCRVAFDHDPRQLPDDGDGDGDGADGSFADAFRDAADLSAGRFRYAVPGFWKIKKVLNVGSERRLRESIAMVHDFADRIIQSRREEMLRDGFEKHDLLSRFMASQDQNYSESEVPLRDVVISFLLAGRETTSSALTWFFWLLSSRPDVQRRIRDEVAAVRARRAQGGVDTAVGFDLDELREMHYVHAAITESMRLYPPVPLNSLRAETDDVLPDGTAVQAGWFVAYNSYAMGRMESVWGRDAREFRPERWLNPADGTFRPESPFRYVAFHAGPRVCLGKEMAYIQMKSIVACVLEELDVAVDGAYRPRQVASLTLRMADGLPATVKPRRDI